jgi:hypothetical protein
MGEGEAEFHIVAQTLGLYNRNFHIWLFNKLEHARTASKNLRLT